jgi:hypothetical protein
MNKFINVVEAINSVKKDCIDICIKNNLDPESFNCKDDTRELDVLLENCKKYKFVSIKKVEELDEQIKEFKELLKYYKSVYNKLQYIEQLMGVHDGCFK